MDKILKIVKIEKEYCDYLRRFDKRIAYNYGVKEPRPFVGVLFEVNSYKYFAPLSSPKPKHLKMVGKIDFLKLEGGKLGAINFNNMIPVQENNIIYLDLNKQPQDSLEEKYLFLLKDQFYWLNRHDKLIYRMSRTLYKKYITGTLPPNIAARCCDFKLLEEKCDEYNSIQV